MVARGDPDAPGQVARYLSSARSGGCRLTAVALERLLEKLPDARVGTTKTEIVVT
jgi:hypothetical protein